MFASCWAKGISKSVVKHFGGLPGCCQRRLSVHVDGQAGEDKPPCGAVTGPVRVKAWDLAVPTR